MSDTIDQIPENPSGVSPIAPGTLDDHGTPFDLARHIPKKHPKTGRWMPRGGRKVKPAAPSSGSTSSQQASTATATPEHSTPSSASQADSPAPSFDDIERAAGPAASDTPAAPAGAAPAGDATLPAEAAGEIGARAVYAITGAVIGNHKAATAAGAEHKNIAAVITAYARHRGWAAVGAVALIGTLVAYLLTDGRREPLVDLIKKTFAPKKKPPVSVTPESEPIDITPAPAAAPVVESAPFEKI